MFGDQYPLQMRALRELSCCVGWHYCSAYLGNRARQAGLRDEQECIDETWLPMVSDVNRGTENWVRENF